jgi:Rad3-related DNA helicase
MEVQRRKKAKTYSTEDVMSHFPYKTPREGQIETIESIVNAFSSGKKFAMIEGPTGCGKSVIGMTIARMTGDAYYLTVQKMLQDQLVKDFNMFAEVLKGRNAYVCQESININHRFENNSDFKKLMSQFGKDPDILDWSKGICKRQDHNKLK